MNSQTHCHISSQIADYTDVDESPIEGVFDECSPLADIYKALMVDREVTFQAEWQYSSTTYTAYDILLDRITENADTSELAASIFAAALFNQSKGEAATDLAQNIDFKDWVFDFFKHLQNHVSYMSLPNMDFLNIRGDL